MNYYTYELCDSDGYLVMEIFSAPTSLDREEYYIKHIKPLIPVLSTTHSTPIYLDNRG